VLAVPAVPVEKNEVIDSGLIEPLFDAIKLRHGSPLSALLDRVYRSDPDCPRHLGFLLPPTLDAPPYWVQCKLLLGRALRAINSAYIRVFQLNV
jgi:hypothetical protein